MNRYFFIRRLRGPAVLLLIGVVALMHSMGLLEHPFRWFWPLLLILLGVLMLAERAILAADGGNPMWPYDGVPNQNPMNPGGPYQGQQGWGQQGTGQTAPAQQTAIAPAETHDFGKDPNGGQS